MTFLTAIDNRHLEPREIQSYWEKWEINEVVPDSLCSAFLSACGTVDMVAVPKGTIIHSLILSLDTCDSEGSLVFKQGAWESSRKTWDSVAGVTYKTSVYLVRFFLDPFCIVLSGNRPSTWTTGECDCLVRRCSEWRFLIHNSLGHGSCKQMGKSLVSNITEKRYTLLDTYWTLEMCPHLYRVQGLWSKDLSKAWLTVQVSSFQDCPTAGNATSFL